MTTAVVLALLGGNAFWDIRRKEILPVTVIAAGILGILVRLIAGRNAFGRPASIMEGLAAAGIDLLPGAAMLLFSRASGEKLGGGDALMLCALGIWTGALPALCCFCLGLLLTAAAAGILRLAGRRQKELPFIPFLLAGYVWWRFMPI